MKWEESRTGFYFIQRELIESYGWKRGFEIKNEKQRTSSYILIKDYDFYLE